MKVYQPIINLVKDKNDNLLADYHNIMWKNYFSQLLNIYKVSNIMQVEVHIV